MFAGGHACTTAGGARTIIEVGPIICIVLVNSPVSKVEMLNYRPSQNRNRTTKCFARQVGIATVLSSRESIAPRQIHAAVAYQSVALEPEEMRASFAKDMPRHTVFYHEESFNSPHSNPIHWSLDLHIISCRATDMTTRVSSQRRNKDVYSPNTGLQQVVNPLRRDTTQGLHLAAVQVAS